MMKSLRWVPLFLLFGLAACSDAPDAPVAEPAPVLPDARPGVVEDRFARLALSCIHKEYPNKIGHVMTSDADARAPRDLTPAFYGCFDWHSSVHGHWLLARLARRFPEAPLAARGIEALEQTITPDAIANSISALNASSGMPS